MKSPKPLRRRLVALWLISTATWLACEKDPASPGTGTGRLALRIVPLEEARPAATTASQAAARPPGRPTGAGQRDSLSTVLTDAASNEVAAQVVVQQAPRRDIIRIILSGPTNFSQDFSPNADGSLDTTIPDLLVGTYSVTVMGLDTDLGGQLVSEFGTTSGVTVQEDQTTNANIPFGSFLPDIDPTIQTTTSAFRFEIGYRRVPTATGYFTEVDTDPTFSAPNTFSHADTAVVLSVPALGTYYFRVRAENNTVSASEAKPSDPVAFDVVADLGGPTGDDAGSAMFLGTVNAATGQYVDFNIYPATDEDWFGLDLTTDATLTVEILSASLTQPALEYASPEGVASPSDLDPYLEIFDPGLNLIASDHDDVTREPRLTDVPITADGTHYVRVTSFSQGSVGHYELNITVNALAVARVEVTPTTATIVPTGQVQLMGQTFDQFDVELSGREAIWSSSDNAIATVDGTGLVTGQSLGTATITLESEGIQGTATITVVTSGVYDGGWSGETSQSRVVSFPVLSNGISRIRIGFSVPACGVTGTITTNFSVPVPVAPDGTFSRSVSSSPLSYDISGTLDAGTGTASGSVSFTYSQTFPFSCTGTASATWSATLGAVDPSTSQITAAPSSIPADGSSTSTITVQLKDASDNNLALGGDAVALATTLGTLSGVTDNGDGSYAATLTSASTPGTATVTGVVNGQAITDDASVTFGSSADPSTSQITATPSSIPADGSSTSTITVQLKDASDNNLAVGGDAVALATTLGTLSGVTDNGDGSYTATLTAGTTVGTATVTGTLNSVSITDDATVALTSLGCSAQAISIHSTVAGSLDPSDCDAAHRSGRKADLYTFTGSAGQELNIRMRATFDTYLFLIDTDGTSVLAFDDDCPGDGLNSCLLGESLPSAGTYTIEATAFSTSGSGAYTLILSAPPSAATSTIAASPTSIPADGSSTSTITVQLKDVSGNDLHVGEDAVTLATTLGTLSAVTDNDDGTYTATLTAGTTSGAATISGTVNTVAMTNSASVALGASPATSTITASPTSIRADGASTSAITVQLKDAGGINLSTGGAAVTLATTLGTLSAVTDNGDGTYSATLTAGLTAGTATITGTVSGVSITDDDVVILTTGAASASTSTITASPTTIEPDGSATSTITVQLKDDLGVDLIAGGDAVSLATDLGTLSGVTDNGNGTYTATLTAGLTAGTATITGTLNTVSMTNTATVTVTFPPPDPATSTITASPTSIVADGAATSTITVQLKDVTSTNLTTGGDAVTLATTLGTLSAVTDNGNGTYTATLTSATTAGTATVTGTVNAASITDNATVTFDPGPAEANTSTITAFPTSIPADGTSTSTITVQLKDATGNDLTVGGDAVTLATTLGTLGPVTDNGDGSYAATLTSGTTVGAALVTGTVNGVTITDDANITLTTPSATTGRLDTAAPNNGLSTDGSGIFVDLTATSGNLVVTEIGMVSYGSTGTPIRLRVWRREGTYVGFDGASSGWSVVDQVDATSAGRDDPTTFVLNNPIDLTQGQVTGFLFEGEIGGVRYTGPTSSQTTWTDANLTLFSDRSRGILFGGFVNTPRNFSGYIQYSGSTPPPASAGRIR